MEKRVEITQETFDALVRDAIEDLLKGGLEKDGIIHILEEQFGRGYVLKLCGEALQR